MQTFLPFVDFQKSLRVLDYRRLGKQRVEAFQLLCANGYKWALTTRTKRTGKIDTPAGWINHPAAIMWRGYDKALCVYMNLCIAEWLDRGYNNTMEIHSYLYNPFFTMKDYREMVTMPKWLGDEALHASHRSNLLRKAPEHYGQFGWTESDNLEYVWPNND